MNYKKVSAYFASGVLCTALACTGVPSVSVSAAQAVNTSLPVSQSEEIPREFLRDTASVNFQIVSVTQSMIQAKGLYTAVQGALNEARTNATDEKPYKIVVEPGTYTLEQSLRLYSNTYLYMNGVTVTQAKGVVSNMVKTGDSEEKATGYFYRNITVEGGVWDANGNSNTVVKVGHAKNFTLLNATVKNVKNAHLMETAGIDGMTVKGCTFEDQIQQKDGSTICYEALQLDVLVENHIADYVSEDLSMKNITVDNCKFINVPRGVGSHTAILNSPMSDIRITNNTFTKTKSAAIQGMNWVNCTISGNKIDETPRGIVLYSVRDEGTFLSSTVAKEGGVASSTPVTYQKPAADQNIKITDNTITCAGEDPYADYEKSAVLLGGISLKNAHQGEDGDKIPAGNYYVSGAEITDNTITTVGHGIRLEETRNSLISNNTITYKGVKSGKVSYHGIQLRENSTSNSITKNTIRQAHSNGIYVNAGSSAKSISVNKIDKAGKHGIDVEKSKATTISKNKITSPVQNGIYLYDKTTVSKIDGNTIYKPGKYGIDAENSKAITISRNKITSPAQNGIYLFNKATAGKIDGNTITSPGKYGIDAENSSVSTVSKNTISKPVSHGIFIYSGGKIKTISGNKITSGKAHGIYVNSLKSDMSIKDNTISGCEKNLIQIHPASAAKYTISLKGNKLTGTHSVDGIHVNGGNVTVEGNSINSVNKAVYIGAGAKGEVLTNTYSNNKANKVIAR